MAKMTNRIAFQKGIIYEEDGDFYIEEIKNDSSKTFNLSEHIRKYASSEDDENPRVVDLTINEVFQMEGSGD